MAVTEDTMAGLSSETQKQQQQQERIEPSDETQTTTASTHSQCSGNINDDDDDYGGDELLAELLGGGSKQQQQAKVVCELNPREAEKTWNNLDSVHSRASTYADFGGCAGGNNNRDSCFDESGSSFASFGGSGSDDDSESDLNASTICELKNDFQRLDSPVKSSSSSRADLMSSMPMRPRFPMTKSMSVRGMQRGASFRGSLDLIKENSFH